MVEEGGAVYSKEVYYRESTVFNVATILFNIPENIATARDVVV